MTIRRPVTINAGFVLLSCVWMVLGTSTALAQAEDYDKFSLSIGLFFTDRNSDTRLDATGMPGTPVDLENDLGLDNSDSVFRIDGSWRFKPKHRIDFSVFDLSRDSTAVLQRDIDWNGTLFPISTTIDSDFDLAIYNGLHTRGCSCNGTKDTLG